VKAVHKEPHVGVAMRIHFDKVWYDCKRVGPAVSCIQLFNGERAFSGSDVDRVVKMEQEHLEVFFSGKLLRSQF
jgi:hypothetical protein